LFPNRILDLLLIENHYFCRKHFIIEQSAFINIDLLPGDARKELKSFFDFLVFKYKINKRAKTDFPKKKQFTAISIDTKGFKFNRDEANER